MVEQVAPALLLRWQNFYVIVGSAAAALTALQFVVLALLTQIRLRSSANGIDAFSTPSIVYFSTVLLLSSVLCAPWNGLAGVGSLIALCGAAGTVYAMVVARRAVRQDDYRLVVEDWVWHVTFPLVAHIMMLGAALLLIRRPAGALFIVAAANLLLLFVGIHNAWDTVTYMVIQRMKPPRLDEEGDPREPPTT